MKKKIFLVVFIFCFNFSSVLGVTSDEVKIHKNLRCLVCQGQSIADSNSEFALTLKMVVKDLIDEGKTDQEIYNFLSDKYGEWILYNPKFNTKNFILWVLPYSALVLGGIFLVFLIRKPPKKT